MAKQMLKRKDGSTSQRGLWDNIRANKGSGKKPTKQMLQQERKIKLKKADKGYSVTSQTTEAPGRVTYYSESYPGTRIQADTTGFAAGQKKFPLQINYRKTASNPQGKSIYSMTGRKGVSNLIKSQQAQAADKPSNWPSMGIRGGAKGRKMSKALFTRKPGTSAAIKAANENQKYGGTIKSKTKKK